jgi:hypothetical protein
VHRRGRRHGLAPTRALWGPKLSEDEYETEYETVFETESEAAAGPTPQQQQQGDGQDAAPASSTPAEATARAAGAPGVMGTIRAQVLQPLQPMLPYLVAARPLVADVSFSGWVLALSLLLAVRQGRVQADEDRLDYGVLQASGWGGRCRTPPGPPH